MSSTLDKNPGQNAEAPSRLVRIETSIDRFTDRGFAMVDQVMDGLVDKGLGSVQAAARAAVVAVMLAPLGYVMTGGGELLPDINIHESHHFGDGFGKHFGGGSTGIPKKDVREDESK